MPAGAGPAPMTEWILRVLGVTVAAFFLDRVVARRTVRAPPSLDPTGAVIVHSPVVASALRGVFSVLIGAIGVVILVTPFEGVPLYGRLLGGAWFLLPAILGAWWCGHNLSHRFVLREGGVEVQRGPRNEFLAWSDVDGVDCSDYGPMWKWMTLTAGGRKVRIPLDVPGSQLVYVAARDFVAAERWDDHFLAFESKATGRLPGG